MLHLIIKLALIIVVICLVPITLICAQSYDDSELRAFLTPPEGCPAPCFMGIRPGVTTKDEAIAILEAHEWVAEVLYDEDFNYIRWQWVEQYSSILTTNSLGSVRLTGNIVQDIVITTRLRLGDVMTVYGQPRWGQAIPVWGSSGTPGMSYLIGYRRNFPKFRFLVPSRILFGRVNFVINTEITLCFCAVEADKIAKPSLWDFIMTAEKFLDN